MEIANLALAEDVQEQISIKGHTILRVLKTGWCPRANWVFLTQKENNQYALKLSFANLSSEVSLFHSLKSNILPEIVDNGKIQGYYYIVTKYCEKGTLADLVQSEGALLEPAAKPYFAELLDILEYLHRQKVSHMDLKPENVVLDDRGKLQCIDFGHSREGTKALAVKSNLTGTLKINAPERFSEKFFNGFSADVYSLGITLLHILSGSYAFKQATLSDSLFSKFCQRRAGFFHYYQMLVDLQRGIVGAEKWSEDLVDLLNRLLEPNPADRITIEGIKSHRWLCS